MSAQPETAAVTAAPATATGPGPDDLAEPVAHRSRFARNLLTIAMVWRREMIRLGRSRARIVTGLAQPLLFLFVMGVGLGRVIGADDLSALNGRSGQGQGVSYQEFLFPGVLGMSVLFSAMFSAISIVWDREFGFLREMLVAPVSRAAIVLGKAVGGASQAVAQGVILLAVAPAAGVHLKPLETLEMLGFLTLLAFAIVSFGIVVASRMQRVEGFQVVMSLVAQPMLFLSGAIFPLQNLPTWLQVLTRLNPMSYGVDPVRRVLLGDGDAITLGGEVLPIWSEALIMLALGAAMITLAVRLFGREA